MLTHSFCSIFKAPRSVPNAPSRSSLAASGLAASGFLARVLAVGIALALFGCGKPEPAAVATMPPPAVIAVAAKSQAIEEEARFVGRIVAVSRVELRARVEGFLKERRFVEGDPVTAGEVLFLIEPEQYEAIVQQRQADVTKAQADAQNADAQLKRGQELLKQKNIAQAKVDELQAAAAVARASITQAQAALAAAQLDLNYTRILAPISGRIGLSQYTVGTLVSPASGVLATLVDRDPISVQFPLTQRELLDARRDVKARNMDPKQVVVRVRLPDDSLYEHPGYLDFVDVTATAGTDSVTLRAELPNPDGILVDGQYVGVLLQSGTPETAILIPQSAMQIDQQGVYVLIVDDAGKAQLRRIETGALKGANIAVTRGLQAGELVIAEGIQKVRPGQAVKTVPAATNADAAP